LAKLTSKIKAFRDAGYSVNGAYVSLPTDLAVKLAHLRGEKTGRFVPETVLRETHAAVSQTLPKAMRAGLFDRVTLHDTTIEGHPVLVASSNRSGKIKIHNKVLWQAFLQKGK
jgi:predicted ABC-type ATPase